MIELMSTILLIQVSGQVHSEVHSFWSDITTKFNYQNYDVFAILNKTYWHRIKVNNKTMILEN